MKRLGRWIDFENDYKTMNPDFMESVWWVFKELHKKGLVYRGFKVCTRVVCGVWSYGMFTREGAVFTAGER